MAREIHGTDLLSSKAYRSVSEKRAKGAEMRLHEHNRGNGERKQGSSRKGEEQEVGERERVIPYEFT